MLTPGIAYTRLSCSVLRLGQGLMIVVLFSSCQQNPVDEYIEQYRQVYANYEGQKAVTEIAYIRKDGARLYLQGAPRQLYDILKLTPGDYIINYIYYSDRRRGMAHCKLEAGQRYFIRTIGRQMMPRSRTWMMIGKCEVQPPPY